MLTRIFLSYTVHSDANRAEIHLVSCDTNVDFGPWSASTSEVMSLDNGVSKHEGTFIWSRGVNSQYQKWRTWAHYVAAGLGLPWLLVLGYLAAQRARRARPLPTFGAPVARPNQYNPG